MECQCRLCLSRSPSEDIFELNLTIVDALQHVLKIEKEDSLPKLICKLCVDVLRTMEDFVVKCQESDGYLRKKMSISIKEEPFASESDCGDYQDLNDDIHTEFAYITVMKFDEVDKIENEWTNDVSKENVESKKTQVLNENKKKSYKCKHCQKESVTLPSFISHIKKHNLDLFPCPFCAKKFAREQSIIKHLEMHNIMLLCELCDKLYDGKDKLKNHVQKYHKYPHKEYPCKFCLEIFRSWPMLKKHIQDNHRVNVYKCHFCSKEFNKRRLIVCHLKIHGYRPPCDRIKCELCPASYSSKGHLRKHTEIHCQEKKFTCSICQRVYGHLKALVEHLKNAHGEKYVHPKREKVKRTNTDYLLCPTCGKSFIGTTNLSRHQNIHSTDIYQCDICAKIFHIKERLKKHLLTHVSVSMYECELCPKTFKSSWSRTLHTNRVHLNKFKKVNCDICQKEYSSNTSLKHHKRIHTGEKSHQCNICHRYYRERSTLKKHVETHSEERPFTCKFCPSCFKTMDCLKEHERLHTGETPFKCPICLRGYAQRCNMKSHFRHNHKELDYKEEWAKYKLKLKKSKENGSMP